MSTPYSTVCDDFYINVRLGSQLTLPQTRETMLHFFERIQKAHPGMVRFRKGEGGEYCLEEDRTGNEYRWLSLEPKRLSAGHVNPADLEAGMGLHKLVLELAPYHLGISPVEIEHFDVLFGFDLGYGGNHDEVIAESILADSPLSCLLEEPGARPVDVQPMVTVALSEDGRYQARVEVVTRTSNETVRTGEASEDVISVYLILRRYWGDRLDLPTQEMLAEMTERADAMCQRMIVPRIVRPIGQAIASRS